MTQSPRYGQRASQPRAETCPAHPGVPAVAYCKKCNRPACADCAIPTEVGSVCVDCAGRSGRRQRTANRLNWQALRNAPVTYALVAVNVLVWIGQLVYPALTSSLAYTPLLTPSQPWRMLTCAFAHAGFFHLLFNMLMLGVIGASVERTLGWWRYLCVYLVAAFAGSMGMLAWATVNPMTVTVGASGAIYGLFGAILIFQRKSGMSVRSIMVLLGINVAYSLLASGIAWQAHLGGFAGGAAATAIFWYVDRYVVNHRRVAARRGARTALSLLALSVLVLAMAAGTFGLSFLVFQMHWS